MTARVWGRRSGDDQHVFVRRDGEIPEGGRQAFIRAKDPFGLISVDCPFGKFIYHERDREEIANALIQLSETIRKEVK